MKRRSLQKEWLIYGALLTMAFGCQPKASPPPTTNSSEAQNPIEEDDQNDDADDGDDGAYSEDKCSSWEAEPESPTTVAPALEVSDIREAVREAGLAQLEAEASVSESQEPTSPGSEQTAILEAVPAVEVVGEYQTH